MGVIYTFAMMFGVFSSAIVDARGGLRRLRADNKKERNQFFYMLIIAISAFLPITFAFLDIINRYKSSVYEALRFVIFIETVFTIMFLFIDDIEFSSVKKIALIGKIIAAGICAIRLIMSLLKVYYPMSKAFWNGVDILYIICRSILII